MSEQFAITIGFTNTKPPTVTASPESVEVDHGQAATISLSLVTSMQGAVFARDPVAWDGVVPPGVRVTRNSDTLATISETDEDPVTTSYSFRAQVSYNGQTYQSPDPLLINKGEQ